MQSEIPTNDPEKRILTLLDFLKEEVELPLDQFYEVRFTRQQIVDMLGLRVETVIRAIKKLEGKKEIKIVQQKVFR